MDFQSPDQLIKAAQAAKQGQRNEIGESLAPIIDDPHAFSIPAALVADIEALMQQYGDEALKAVAMWSLGTWHGIHADFLEQHNIHGDHEAALWVMSDLAKLGLCLQVLADIGSIGGDEQWKQMLKANIGQAVIEHLEETGLSLQQIIARKTGHEQA